VKICRLTGDKGTGMADETPDRQNIQASDNSVAAGNISIQGSVAGNFVIGNTGFTAGQVSSLLTQISTTFQPKPFDGRSPYKGLDYFEEEDARLFFGREKLVDDLVRRVKESRTLFVTGPSGSGKSSLVRAGLIHAMKQGCLKESERWLYGIMKPGREPIAELARVTARLAKSTNAEDEILARAVSDPAIFRRWCEIALEENEAQRVVLFIDQFEEVFTQINKETANTFIELLDHSVSRENGRIILLFAMRSDFVSNCATVPKLNALLNRQFVQIGSMQPEELVSAIAQPALRVGLRIDPDLIAQIINDMQGEPGVLPLMQFALKDLFDAEQAKGGVIALTLNDYLQRGGIRKALERHADDSFNRLDSHEQELARSIFSGLIEIGRGTQDTRRTAIFDELIPASVNRAEVQAVVHKLADARLVTTDEMAGWHTVTISHEKLIDAWPWLKKLVDENRDVIALQNEITDDAEEWESNQHNASYLYSGARLATAREKTNSLILSERAQTFLKTSITIEEEARRRSERTRRRIFSGLAGFSMVVLGLFVFALLQLQASRAQQLGYQAQVSLLSKDYYEAGLYALQSNKIQQNDIADSVLGKLPYQNFILSKTLQGYAGYTTGVAWSRDGKLASASDRSVIIWDLETGKTAQILTGHTNAVTNVAWSRDGRLASGSSDRSVIIWDLKTGKPAQILTGHTDAVTSVAWSDDGRLASGSSDKSVIIWDLKTGKPARMLMASGEVTSVAWSSDGRLAFGTSDKSVIVWDPKIEKPAQILTGHTDAVTSVAWSDDGKLASGSSFWDDRVLVWDLTTGKPVHKLQRKYDLGAGISLVNSVIWSTDEQLASGYGDGMVIRWDVDAEKPIQTLQLPTGFTPIQFPPGDSYPAYYDHRMAWSADGRLATLSEDLKVVIWNLAQQHQAQTLLGHTKAVTSVAWSTDGQLASGSEDRTVIIWNPNSGKLAQTLTGQNGAVTSVAWSTDSRLASGSADKVVIWNLNTGSPAEILADTFGEADRESAAFGRFPTSVAWSVDGQLASSSYSRSVTIWNLKTGKPAEILQGHTYIVDSIAWSLDGRLASGDQDGNVIIWNLKTGKPAQVLKASGGVTSVAWSADGRLASGSDVGTIIIWNLKTGKPAETLTLNKWFTLFTSGNINGINALAWSSDGRLASASTDNTAIIWDLVHKRPIQILTDHTGTVNSVAWSADGQLASASEDKTIGITRADLTGVEPCDWVFQNMSLTTWTITQGLIQEFLYPYEMACPNLPAPNIPWWLTLQGHFIYFGVILINIGLIWGVARRIRNRVLFGIAIVLMIVGSLIANIYFLAWFWPNS
jgi:WD40 repeat protein